VGVCHHFLDGVGALARLELLGLVLQPLQESVVALCSGSRVSYVVDQKGY